MFFLTEIITLASTWPISFILCAFDKAQWRRAYLGFPQFRTEKESKLLESWGNTKERQKIIKQIPCDTQATKGMTLIYEATINASMSRFQYMLRLKMGTNHMRN